ncbi:MAG: glycine dehydrogenase subunit 2 [Calditrichaeota bacterium]|nr:MAG: glycine dehydrogenase subunit 2 [Calditrichota bacterium]
MEKLLFEKSISGRKTNLLPSLDVPEKNIDDLLPKKYRRKQDARLPELSELDVVRHFVRLSILNHHVDKGFYPLGSCTMKYNPFVNEDQAGLPGFQQLHPLQPESTVQGALELMYLLQEALKEISGMAEVSLQPAAGAHGELTGMMMIRKYHETQGDKRKYVLIPDSAHGTNPASATIAGYQALEIPSDASGCIDIAKFKEKLNPEVAALMLTNPNTLGLFEEHILEITQALHEIGALAYMDGANLNALLGIARPGDMGFDVVHINLHKTFSTPHGGGGPGAGPVAVSSRLADFLPVPGVKKHEKHFSLDWDRPLSIGKVSSFYGNFGVFVRAYTYIRMHGSEGLRRVSENAIINANYLRALLEKHFPVPYTNRPMHEFVATGEKLRKYGLRTLDLAKRLLDFGLHAPTIYFPLIVREAMMIEPTETESKETLDTFAKTMEQILQEAMETPEILHEAPHNTPVGRLDEVRAVRQLDINYFANQ